jgi:oligopeptide/dipeptide ABC transporter ATP-binding protein
MIFQDPLTSLNPSFTIGRQLVDVQRAHTQSVSRREVRRRALEVLVQVGIPDAAERLEHYPHEFSGGMRQRIMIAMALVLEPALLIADEPTSSLDVTLRAQILALLRRLRDEHGTAILLISHDLDVVEQICDRMLVMYAGRPVEYGDVPVVLAEPRHPYTKALLWARPSVGRRGAPLKTIPGRVPSLADLPRGCAFCGRCSEARLTCHRDAPRYLSVDQRYVRCHVYDPDSDYLASPAGSPVPQEGVE